MKDPEILLALLTIWTTTLLAMFFEWKHVEKGIDSTGGSFHDLLQKKLAEGCTDRVRQLEQPIWNTCCSCLPLSETGQRVLVAAIIHPRFRTEQPAAFSDCLPLSG